MAPAPWHQYLAKIEALGGMVSAIKRGYVQNEIAQSAFAYEMGLEEKRKIIVGMNLHVEPAEECEEHACYQLDPALRQEQIETLREFKNRRDLAKVASALEAVRETAARPESNENNVMVPIKDKEVAGRIYELAGRS